MTRAVAPGSASATAPLPETAKRSLFQMEHLATRITLKTPDRTARLFQMEHRTRTRKLSSV